MPTPLTTVTPDVAATARQRTCATRTRRGRRRDRLRVRDPGQLHAGPPGCGPTPRRPGTRARASARTWRTSPSRCCARPGCPPGTCPATCTPTRRPSPARPWWRRATPGWSTGPAPGCRATRPAAPRSASATSWWPGGRDYGDIPPLKGIYHGAPRWGVADALRAAAPLPVAWSQRVTFCETLSGRGSPTSTVRSG
jgi:hypothetical protein